MISPKEAVKNSLRLHQQQREFYLRTNIKPGEEAPDVKEAREQFAERERQGVEVGKAWERQVRR